MAPNTGYQRKVGIKNCKSLTFGNNKLGKDEKQIKKGPGDNTDSAVSWHRDLVERESDGNYL